MVDEDSAWSRRRFLGVAAAGLATLAACDSPAAPPPSPAPQPSTPQPPAPVADGVLAANFNGDPKVLSFPELENLQAKWVRGFFAMPDADHGDPGQQPAIKALLDASAQGYGTVLSLKFPFFERPIPQPGEPAMVLAERRLDAVLAAVMDKVGILAIGNEPFIECEDGDRASDRLNVFYETMAQRAIAYRDAHPGTRTQLYMGALNRLDQASWRTAATERWMRFVRDTRAIAGTDIHPHLPDPAAGHDYLDYVLPRLRPDQKFLATEFSLVLLYKKHLTDPVTEAFSGRYGAASGTPVWQVLKNALERPFPQQKWTDFLASNPWFADNANFLTEQMNAFRATGKLAVAAYGIGQDDAMSADSFGPGSTPWLLNSMFCQHTVRRTGELPGQNTTWTDQFRALQRA